MNAIHPITTRHFHKTGLTEFALAVAFCCALGLSADACTIFVLTDTNRALFFNNEDWSNPKSRIWFVPSGNGYYGCAYVGFDDGAPQGGVNTEGLAWDVVAGFREGLTANPSLPPVRGHPCQRILHYGRRGHRLLPHAPGGVREGQTSDCRSYGCVGHYGSEGGKAAG
jgi:hypothetical protein